MGSPVPPDERPGRGVASAGPAASGGPALPPGGPPPPGAPPHRRRRKILIWTAGITAGLVAIAAVGVFLLYRHLNGNIQQRDVSGLLGSQPVDLHPQAENILVIGSDSRFGLSARYGRDLTTDQSDTMMIVHIPARPAVGRGDVDPARLLGQHPGLRDGQRPDVLAADVQDQRGVRHRQPGREQHQPRRGLHDQDGRAGHRHLHRPFRRGQLHRPREHGGRARRRARSATPRRSTIRCPG